MATYTGTWQVGNHPGQFQDSTDTLASHTSSMLDMTQVSFLDIVSHRSQISTNVASPQDSTTCSWYMVEEDGTDLEASNYTLASPSSSSRCYTSNSMQWVPEVET